MVQNVFVCTEQSCLLFSCTFFWERNNLYKIVYTLIWKHFNGSQVHFMIKDRIKNIKNLHWQKFFTLLYSVQSPPPPKEIAPDDKNALQESTQLFSHRKTFANFQKSEAHRIHTAGLHWGMQNIIQYEYIQATQSF